MLHMHHLHWLHTLQQMRLAATVTIHVRPAPPPPVLSYYNCSELMTLWDSQGGNHGAAFVAAEVAKAESGGYIYATGPAGERGLWQIHPDHGALSTYNPVGNARAAISISGNGANWSPWTTYTSGAYIGRCLCYTAREGKAGDLKI